MADVKWIKITTTMFDDEKIDFIESLPESDAILIIWIKLLTLAGKCNASGYIYLTENIPYTEDMLAHKFRRSLNVVRLALQTFLNLQMIEVDETQHLRIVNWEKHQNIEGLEKIREQTRKRVAEHREKKKLANPDVTLQVTIGNALDKEEELDKEKKKNTGYSPEFESFWSVYPRKVSKKDAFKNWNTRLKSKVAASDLIQAATNYSSVCKKRGTLPEYILHPATFLGPNEKYLDYLQIEVAVGAPVQPKHENSDYIRSFIERNRFE